MDKKATVEDTPRISIQPFRQHAEWVRETGETVEGRLPFLGEDHALVMTKQDDVIELAIDDVSIVLKPEESHLVPGTIGHWYFVCPECGRRCKDLYRPELEDEFACRLCHDLTYRSSQDQHKNEALYNLIGAETGLHWEIVRDLTHIMAPGWDED